ncbi:hypothetical protein EDD17DRAFT_1762602 [Pisolithus thermaeus]|nr:hypothetical protein EDD17DRAFT_1762602 [Pisolithus thermaeus]
MAKDLIETVQRTMGSHVVMFVGHESGEGQIKLAVFESAPGDGKKVFTESSQSSKDWVLTAESILTDYLLEEDSAEKQEVEISLDEDGNPEVPTWGGQKLKVQQSLARAVFQDAYAKFTKMPEAKVPWGLLIKSPMEYLDSESIPEGFTMKDPSKWTKADLGLLWDHCQSPEAEEKMIVSFIDCKKEDAPCPGSLRGKWWEAKWVKQAYQGLQSHSTQLEDPLSRLLMEEPTTDAGPSNPEESSPAWHARKDQICYLKSLSIVPRYQVLVDVVDALPEQQAEERQREHEQLQAAKTRAQAVEEERQREHEQLQAAEARARAVEEERQMERERCLAANKRAWAAEEEITRLHKFNETVWRATLSTQQL